MGKSPTLPATLGNCGCLDGAVADFCINDRLLRFLLLQEDTGSTLHNHPFLHSAQSLEFPALIIPLRPPQGTGEERSGQNS